MRHGTIDGYNRHRCRCDECKAAHRERCITNRQRRLDQRIEVDGKFYSPIVERHGTTNGYRNYGCRCAGCTAAHGRGCRDYYRAKAKERA